MVGQFLYLGHLCSRLSVCGWSVARVDAGADMQLPRAARSCLWEKKMRVTPNKWLDVEEEVEEFGAQPTIFFHFVFLLS